MLTSMVACVCNHGDERWFRNVAEMRSSWGRCPLRRMEQGTEADNRSIGRWEGDSEIGTTC